MKESVEINLSNGSSKLYVFFGGIAAGIAMPPFEFYSASQILNENKIFIRDFRQSWYQSGLLRVSKDIDATAEYLKQQVQSVAPDKLYFVGNSMGGFAAILFASLVGKGEAIAFAPQTFISPSLRWKYGDRRWQKNILRTYARSFHKRKVWDLREVLEDSHNTDKVSIFVSKADRLDYIHACHVADFKQVQVHAFDDGGHGIVRSLRDDGKLQAILSGSFA